MEKVQEGSRKVMEAVQIEFREHLWQTLFSKLEIDHFFRDLTHLLFNSEVCFPFNKRIELNFRRNKIARIRA